MEGAYHITVVAQNRACLFGNVDNREMILNDAGAMIRSQWEALPQRFLKIELDEFIVMPNHFHGIIVITDKESWAPTNDQKAPIPSAGLRESSTTGAPTCSSDDHDPILGEIIGAWKSMVTDEYIVGVRKMNWEPFDRKLLQRNYWEHIIRNERDLNRIREYILNNPANWDSDEHNPKNANP